MSELTATPAGSPGEPSGEAPSGPVSMLGNLLVAPADAFRAILARPSFVLPLALTVMLSLVFTGIWTQKVDMGEMQKAQLIEMGFWEKMPPEAREQALANKPGVGVWLAATLINPALILILAGFFLFVYRFFYGGEVTFKQSLSILCWTWAVTGLVATPLMLLIFYLKGDWNIPPDQILQANVSLLLDKESVHKVLWSLGKSLDAFSFWLIFLLSTGFGIAVRKPVASALWGVAIPWVVIVAGKLALAAIF
jgi:hypothetical protein